MNINKNLSEIKAEVLLNFLFPEMEQQWVAHCEGTFYRNYSGDAMAIDEDEKTVHLSRDGFMQLLPQGLYTQEDELRGRDAAEKYKELERRKQLLHETFLPIDTYTFQEKLTIERQASELLNDKLDYVLKTYFGFDLEQQTSQLVQEAAVLLPYVARYRGDLGFVANLLAALMRCEVRMRTGRYSQSDSTVRWLPSVRYELLIPDLTPAGYQQQRDELEPLADFIKEWMIPFEVHCDIVIKEHGVRRGITLDYNTEITNH